MKLGILERPDFLLFTAARVIGIGIRPLILFFAATRGFSEFSDAFALFVTAVAGSFVIFGNEAHIRLYKAAFNGTRNIFEIFLATRFFILSLFTHIIWFSAVGAVLLFVWTGNVWLSLFGLVVLIAEKTYDEYQRFYTFQRAYIKWTIGFAFRYGLPGLTVIAAIALGIQPTLPLYIVAYLVAAAVYVVVWERRSMALYLRLYARGWHGGRQMLAYAKVYAKQLYANQAWSFLLANYYLIDRMLISRSDVSLGSYVFFCNLFNLAVFVHTTLYFVQRRADLINDNASLRREFLRLPNLVPPFLYTLGVAGISWLFTQLEPAYAGFDLVLIFGLGVYFFAQAISLVAIDFIFWRLRKEILLVVDLILGALVVGSCLLLGVSPGLVPLVLTGLIGLRILAYAIIWNRTEKVAPKA